VPRLVARLLQHPNITLHCNTALRALAKHSRWQADTTQGTMQADAVILACAHACADFAPLRLAASAGQVSLVPVAQATATLQSIVCHRGYIIPEGEHYLVGATYDHEDLSGTVTETNHAHNRAEAEAALPGWLQSGTEGWKGRTSLRATTPDRLPYVGALGEGLYVSTGHGSRGLLSAPLGAECIASLIAGEPVPLEREVWQAVTPSPSGRGQG